MRLSPSDTESESPNLIPMIDVVFLLLIFFLVATRFDQEEREISTRLAEVSKAQPLSMKPKEVVVNVTERGEYIVIGSTLDEDTLAGFLHDLAMKNPGTQTIQIRADDRVPFRYPAKIMGLCERERIEHYCSVVEKRQ